MTRPRVHDRDRDRGSEVVAAAVGVPAFVLFIALIIAAGRIAITHQAVEAAAADAARAASISRNPAQASTDATTAAAASLANQQLRCTSSTVEVDTRGFAVRVGLPATVTATVTCVVNLSDVAVPGLPGSTSITETMTSPLDTYRER